MHTDEHLLAILEKYDGWMREGKIPYTGKILPRNVPVLLKKTKVNPAAQQEDV